MPEREVRAALARHAATRALANCPFEIVPGGLSNHAWRAGHAGESCFIRLGASDAERLGVDRASECRMLAIAAAAGLAPQVIACDPASRLLVTRFVPGRHWSRTDAGDPRNLRRLGESLQRLHALPPTTDVRRLDFPVQAAQLEAGLAQHESIPVALQGPAQGALEVLHARQAPVTLCHNDLHHLNVIDDGGRLWLVDWEYSGAGDPLFDLAGLICLHQLSGALRAAFLEAYGHPCLATGAELDAACRLFDYVQWLWFRLWMARHPAAAGEYAERARMLAGRLGGTSGKRHYE
ncbi:MAG: phosphotransferase [Steroidobacteraceae bacterium]